MKKRLIKIKEYFLKNHYRYEMPYHGLFQLDNYYLLQNLSEFEENIVKIVEDGVLLKRCHQLPIRFDLSNKQVKPC